VTAAVSSPAVRAIADVLASLEAAAITATRDPGAFYPQPVGVLVGLPSLASRNLQARIYEIPVLVVSGDPLNAELAVDRLCALADDVALALGEDAYRPSSWRNPSNAEPYPALEITVTVLTPESEV
jgi:hypothetical protein